MTWAFLQFAITVVALGYIWHQDGKLRLHQTLSAHWRQCCEDRQRTINRMLATPELVRPEQRTIVVDRQRLN